MDNRLAALIAAILTASAAAFLPQVSGLHDEGEPIRSYRLEDFLWSGSGDGDSTEREEGWRVTTVLPTATQLVTGAAGCQGTCPVSPSPTSEAVVPTSTVPFPAIVPTPPEHLPDQRYWLVTVLIGLAPPPPELLERRLAQLYTIAFHRQQERHLKLNGANSTSVKRGAALKENRDNISVKVHRVSTGDNGTGVVEIIYSVKVAGRPVDARVAAQDMALVSDKEVTARLGHAVLTKAEPFLKPVQPLEVQSQRNTLLLLGASVCAFLLVVILIILFALGVRKNKRNLNKATSCHTSQEEELPGVPNMNSDGNKAAKSYPTPRRLNSEEDSLVHQSTEGQPSPQPLPRYIKPSSPNSYLSMSSVKAFPRGAEKPRLLEEMLEPDPVAKSVLLRHKSDSTDPGIVGPIVWDLHCQRANKEEQCDDVGDIQPSIGRMRRRFQELLEDAFTLFGSQNGTQEDYSSMSPKHQARAKSAIVPFEENKPDQILRPKTSDTCRPATASSTHVTRGAWESTPPSTPPQLLLPRPLSAGPFHRPILEPAWIATNAKLEPTDSAIPLIEAIKEELDKFPSKSPSALKV